MTAPRRTGGSDASTRGIIVLVAAVVIGVILLAKTGGGGTKVSAGKAGTTTAPVTTTTLATTPTSSSSTPTTTSATAAHDRKVMKVLVLNANGGKNLATRTSTKLKGLGFNASPGPDPAAVPKTAVYYAPDYQADATAVATALGLDPSVVAPLPQTFPSAAVVASRGGKVVVELGKDAPTI